MLVYAAENLSNLKSTFQFNPRQVMLSTTAHPPPMYVYRQQAYKACKVRASGEAMLSLYACHCCLHTHDCKDVVQHQLLHFGTEVAQEQSLHVYSDDRLRTYLWHRTAVL